MRPDPWKQERSRRYLQAKKGATKKTNTKDDNKKEKAQVKVKPVETTHVIQPELDDEEDEYDYARIDDIQADLLTLDLAHSDELDEDLLEMVKIKSQMNNIYL